MARTLIMVDGLGKPPPETWNDLAKKLATFLNATTIFLDYSKFLSGVRNVNFRNQVIVVGHSLGALEVLKATNTLGMTAAIGIDAVHYNWSDDPIKVGTLTKHIRCYRRKRIFSPPPSVGVLSRNSSDNVEIEAGWFGHNKIIEIATPQIVEFVKTVIR